MRPLPRVCLLPRPNAVAYSPPMPDLPDLSEIARIEEARIALGVSEIADLAVPFAGGWMCRAGPGSWANSTMGAGLAGEVTAREVQELIDFYSVANLEPRIEVCPIAHPSLIEHLGRAGFIIKCFENVFFRPLRRDETITAPSPAPPDLRIRVVERTDPDDVELFAQASIDPFLPDGAVITEAMLDTTRRVARHDRCVCLIAELDAKAVSTGAMEDHGHVVALFGLSVLKDYRRRGIQQAMMAWRLNEAARRGAKFATIGARPGIATERNARRMGFQVAYTKVILVKPDPNLAPVVE